MRFTLLTVQILCATRSYGAHDYLQSVQFFRQAFKNNIWLFDTNTRGACHLQVLDTLLAEYEQSAFGATKWQKLVKLLMKRYESFT